MLHVAMNIAFDSPKPVDYLSSLNERQRLAVEHGSGKVARPLLIIAGAGSGKTNTLAHRVVHLIVNGADPRRILLMTFSRRAAVEMTKRVERIASQVLGDRASVMTDGLTWAGTFHSVGARLLPVALAAIERGAARETPQAEAGVTYAKKIKSAEARIDWTRPAAEVDRHIRGLSPFPGAWFEAPSDKGLVRVKALLSRVEDAGGPPGQALDDALLIACGEGAVRLLKAQREGKGAQDAEVFTRGFPIPAGTIQA